MLNTIYETGYDLHVANYVAYLHTDKKLYEDEAHKVQAKKADVEKAFKLGRLIVVAAGRGWSEHCEKAAYQTGHGAGAGDHGHGEDHGDRQGQGTGSGGR